jgi:hypothetical protein
MKTILKVVEQKEYDRYVFLTYSENEIIGLNYHQGLDEIKHHFAEPDPILSDIFKRYSEKYSNLDWKDRVNNSIELYQKAFVWQHTNIVLPNSQKKLIQKALEYYINQYKTFNQDPTQDEGYEIFDLITLQALFNYNIEIELNEHEVENFTHVNGVDLPKYI